MPQIAEALQWATRNRAQLAASSLAGYYYCGEVFSPSKVTDWLETEDTALCPSCGIDSVIGAASGYELSHRVLKALHWHWFERGCFRPRVGGSA